MPRSELRKEKAVKPKKPYLHLNGVCRSASFLALSRTGIIGVLAKGHQASAANTKVPQFTKAALNMLASQGVLDKDGAKRGDAEDSYITPDKNLSLFVQLRNRNWEIEESMTDLVAIQQRLKAAIGMPHQSNQISGRVENLANASRLNLSQMESLVPAAATYLHEVQVGDDSMGSQLTRGEVIELSSQVPDQKLQELLISVLQSKGLLLRSGDQIRATEEGQALFRIGGYAELLVSYYEMLAKMAELMRGELEYGLGNDVNRDAELNARASNGILNIKVAPYITKSLEADPLLKEALGGNGVHIDYGSGGGDMLKQVVQQNNPNVKKLVGIDINPATVEEAQQLCANEGLGHIEFVTGSITEKRALLEAKKKVSNGTEQGYTASINFILHDVGRELSLKFLAAHADVFGDAPLIITETLNMPMSTLVAHPDYQAASFQFMHEASGQHLYTEEELKELIEEAGYRLVSEKTHSSMPSTHPKKRHNTIVTWVVQHKGKAA